MIKTILFLILVFPLFIQGQVVNHFDNPDSKWQQSKFYKSEQGEWYAGLKFMYFFNGDTLINGEKWLRLFFDAGSNIAPYQPYKPYGLIKSEDQKVYHYFPENAPDSTPSLMYDFSLMVGDTFESLYYGSFYPPKPISFVVNKVDSVLINNIPYKRFKFDKPILNGDTLSIDETWIEGIGSIKRPIETLNFSISHDSILVICTYSNNQFLWQHPDYSECDIADYLKVFDENPLMELQLYPNPTNKSLNIKINEMDDLQTIKIHDIAGRLVLKRDLDNVNEKHIELDISSLVNGIYICTLSGNKNPISKKFIKY